MTKLNILASSVTRNKRAGTVGTVAGDFRNLCNSTFAGWDNRTLKNACVNLGQSKGKSWKIWWLDRMPERVADFKKMICGMTAGWDEQCNKRSGATISPPDDTTIPPPTNGAPQLFGMSLIQVGGMAALALGAIFAFVPKKKKKKRK